MTFKNAPVQGSPMTAARGPPERFAGYDLGMGRAKEALKKELLELKPADRAEVAEDALRSLVDTGYGELSPAWEQEIQKRLHDANEGAAELIPGGDVFREIEAELRARRGER